MNELGPALANQTVSVTASCNDDRQCYGHIELQNLNSKTRALRATKTLGLFWLIALASILIPMIHFVSVPAFLIAGIALGIRAYQVQQLLLSGAVSCPSCGTILSPEPQALRWPVKEICPSCRHIVTVSLSL